LRFFLLFAVAAGVTAVDDGAVATGPATVGAAAAGCDVAGSSPGIARRTFSVTSWHPGVSFALLAARQPTIALGF
jgi:hypothetical protein